MKKVLKLLFPLFVLTLNLAQATNHFSFTERGSCEIAKYSLKGLQTVFGTAGLKLADLNIPYPMDGHYTGDIKYFRIEVKQLFISAANAFSKERIQELSEKGCTFYPYMYFDTTGVNVENYFFLDKGQLFKPAEICALDLAIKNNISAWFAKHGYEEWLLKRSPYLLLYYDFQFSDMLKFLEDGKTFPPSVNNIPEFLQKKPKEEKRD